MNERDLLYYLKGVFETHEENNQTIEYTTMCLLLEKINECLKSKTKTFLDNQSYRKTDIFKPTLTEKERRKVLFPFEKENREETKNLIKNSKENINKILKEDLESQDKKKLAKLIVSMTSILPVEKLEELGLSESETLLDLMTLKNHEEKTQSFKHNNKYPLDYLEINEE